MNRYQLSILIGLTAAWAWGCGGTEKRERSISHPATEKATISAPHFSADSAYKFVQQQVDFGPRVPNTRAHTEAGDFLIKKFKEYGAQVTVQDFEATTFDNQNLYLRNIIASYQPEKTKRILLAAHWDARPFADKDDERQEQAIDAANDGASGVGILLEIARILQNQKAPDVGIDIILFDGEDWGEKEGDVRVAPPRGLESWWCLGSQYWSKNPHTPNYSAYYGILLDMVGGRDARFYIEDYSQRFAPSIVRKVWDAAAQLGHGRYFVSQPGGQIVDDHYFVQKNTNTPMIDIIPMDPATGSFGGFHHTHDDNMTIISKQTLDAVGETVLHVIYNE